MKTAYCRSILGLVITFGLFLAGPPQGRSVPYASGVRSSGGNVSFYLNEDATDVKLIFISPPSTNSIGALPKGGPYVYPLASTAFKIVVSKAGGAGYLQGVTNQISVDTNALVTFVNQRGVAVNRNPASPYFGRIYVSITTAGVNTASGRSVGKGIYVLNPDQTDALGQGNVPLTGGLPFGTGAESPHRVVIGPDDNLYICDWSDPTGTVYVTDPNVGTNSTAKIVLNGQGGPFPVTASRTHGSIGAAWIEGSLGEGNLNIWVIDEDLQTDKATTTRTEQNSVWQWNIGSGPLPFTGVATKFGATQPLLGIASQLADIVRGRDGKWYISQKRDDNASTTGIFVRSSDNSTTLWSSLTATRTMLNNSAAFDLLSSTAAIDISADGKYLIALKQNTNSISILPLTDGIPDLTNRMVLPTFPTTGNGRDVSFDSAGNIYSVSSGQGLLRIYSAGGTTVATTTSDGSFSVFRPPSVGATVLDNLGSEEGNDPVSFNIYRSGNIDNDLTVVYTLTGTAVNGADYVQDPLSAVIPAGATNVIVTLTPIDDSESEAVETVILSVVGSTSFEYDLGSPSGGTARIVDNDFPTISITASKTNVYESLPRDGATFVLTRVGDTNAGLDVLYHYDGTAVPFADYTDDNFTLVSFPPGSTSQTVTLRPLDDTEFEGNETAIIVLDGGGTYAVGTPGSASATFIDDERPPANVLFSEDFDVDSSGSWLAQFGANNNIYDATTIFSYDYGSIGLPPAPHSSGTTRGLFVAVNKNNNTAGGSAGINLYPVGQQFSGDYALRFDMYLSVGASSTTEHALAGLDHSGLMTNRFSQSVDTNHTVTGGDGLWVGIVTDASDLFDYGAYATTNATNGPFLITNRSAFRYASALPSPPYGFAGSPSSSGTNQSWADVELSQIGRIVSLKVNQNLILQVTNSYSSDTGNIMLGMNDQFDSIGSTSNYVIFDNVRVVSMATLITSIELQENGHVQIDFFSPLSINPDEFRLQSATSLSPAVWSDEGAEISSRPGGLRAVTGYTGDTRFYRIVH